MTYSNMIQGLTILAKYSKKGLDGVIGGADHDIMFVTFGDPKLTPEDREALITFGFHYSLEYDCWACFV